MKLLISAVLATVLMSVPALARAEAAPEMSNGIAAAKADYERARRALDKLDWPAAISALESAARHDPRDAEFQNLLGFAHRGSGNMELAFRHYFKALELNPAHRGAHEYIGRAYLMIDKPEKAKEHLKLLEKWCWEFCRERDLLQRAINEYPWPSDPRLSRSY